MQSIENLEEYCDKCDGYHNPIYPCVRVAMKITELDWIKLQKRIEKLITSVKVGAYGK